MNKKTLKETFLKEEEASHDLSEFGGRPILTDYKSMEQVFSAMRKKVYEALKSGDHMAVTEAVRDAVKEGAKYGFVVGWDTAWEESYKERDEY